MNWLVCQSHEILLEFWLRRPFPGVLWWPWSYFYLNVTIWLPEFLAVFRSSTSAPYECGTTRMMVLATMSPLANVFHPQLYYSSSTPMILLVSVLQSVYIRSQTTWILVHVELSFRYVTLLLHNPMCIFIDLSGKWSFSIRTA